MFSFSAVDFFQKYSALVTGLQYLRWTRLFRVQCTYNTEQKKMAQVSNNRNKTKRAALLQQANALLANMLDAPAKKNKKKKIEENQDEEEAGLAESMLNAPVIGELSIPAPKPKPKKTAQNDELDRSLARCTVQRSAGCSVPSAYKFL
jgi:hypothetical protein